MEFHGSFLYHSYSLVCNSFIVIGASGIVGKQIVDRLRYLGKNVITISAKKISASPLDIILKDIQSFCGTGSLALQSSITLGVILAHRCRDIDIRLAIHSELSITRDFIWALAALCSSLRVIVLGSITGRFVDRYSHESYHYAKDLQKSIVRQSILVENLYMNLLELSWFEKYLPEDSFPEYIDLLASIKKELTGNCLPTVNSITDFSCSLIEMALPPRGQIITYDGGHTLLQKKQ